MWEGSGLALTALLMYDLRGTQSKGGIMFRKPFCRMLFTVLSLAVLSACSRLPQASEIAAAATVQPQVPESTATSTMQATETGIVPTPAEVESPDENPGNPCDSLGETYEHDEDIGEIKAEYIGSWHAAPSVGSGYAERFVFFASGNYLFFPSQYECAFGDEACVPSPIEESIWGVQEDKINLAKEGDISNIRSILIGEVIDSPSEESPYSTKTAFDGTSYWLISIATDLWNPETGEWCD